MFPDHTKQDNFPLVWTSFRLVLYYFLLCSATRQFNKIFTLVLCSMTILCAHFLSLLDKKVLIYICLSRAYLLLRAVGFLAFRCYLALSSVRIFAYRCNISDSCCTLCYILHPAIPRKNQQERHRPQGSNAQFTHVLSAAKNDLSRCFNIIFGGRICALHLRFFVK